MISFFKQSWWKILGAILLIYTIIAGLVIPIGPEISNVEKIGASPERLELRITGFNTHFDESTTSIWIKHKDQFFCPQDVWVENNSTLSCYYKLPLTPSNISNDLKVNLVANSDLDGTMTYDRTIELKSSGNENAIDFEIEDQSCDPQVKNSIASGIQFPNRKILYESIRNLVFHVPMWFTMVILLFISMIYSIIYLRTGNEKDDIMASRFALVAFYFGILGILTGMMWAKYTWGKAWPNDPKLNGAAIGMLIYAAYFVLRGSVDEGRKKARLAAVYSIFAFVIFISFIFIVPRLTDSLHPGNGGNPAFSKYDLDNVLRMVFYPAVIGWILFSIWITSIMVRMKLIETKRAQ